MWKYSFLVSKLNDSGKPYDSVYVTIFAQVDDEAKNKVRRALPGRAMYVLTAMEEVA
jgi:hypothetical protein